MVKNILTRGAGTVVRGISAYTNFWRRLARKVLGKSEETNLKELIAPRDAVKDHKYREKYE